jgi:DNA-binding transcriptional LysR family regulator
MEIYQAKVFLALAEEGSMTRAAEHLRVTQPAISSALSGFERELGYVLFHRSRKGLTLTEQGRALLGSTRAFVALAKSIEESGKERRSDAGILRIAGRQGFMQYVFPYLVTELHKIAPEITIERALSSDQQQVVEALQMGTADLAFAASPAMKSISAEVLNEDAIWLAVSRDHPLAHTRTPLLGAIAGLDLCLPLSSDRLRKPIEQFLRKLPKRPRIVLETNDYTLMKNLIERGECAGFIYAHMLLGGRSSLIQPLKLPEMKLKRDLTILHRRDDLVPHVVFARKVFITEARRLLLANAKRFERR